MVLASIGLCERFVYMSLLTELGVFLSFYL